MSNLFNSLSECLGFSQIMKLTEPKTLFALKLMSSRFPMGVDTIYKPFARVSIILTFIFIVSCVPANNQSSQNVLVERYPEKISEVSVIDKENKDFLKKKQTDFIANYLLNTEIEIILPEYKNPNVTRHLINALELSIYKKEIKKTV